MTEYSPAKTGEYPRIFPNFQNGVRCEKDFKDNKDNSRHLGRKYARRIFVLGHYLFLVAHSFSRASLSENCSLLGTGNVRGLLSEHIFAPNGDYCLYIFAPNGDYCLHNLHFESGILSYSLGVYLNYTRSDYFLTFFVSFWMLFNSN